MGRSILAASDRPSKGPPYNRGTMAPSEDTTSMEMTNTTTMTSTSTTITYDTATVRVASGGTGGSADADAIAGGILILATLLATLTEDFHF